MGERIRDESDAARRRMYAAQIFEILHRPETTTEELAALARRLGTTGVAGVVKDLENKPAQAASEIKTYHKETDVRPEQKHGHVPAGELAEFLEEQGQNPQTLSRTLNTVERVTRTDFASGATYPVLLRQAYDGNLIVKRDSAPIIGTYLRDARLADPAATPEQDFVIDVDVLAASLADRTVREVVGERTHDLFSTFVASREQIVQPLHLIGREAA